MPTADPSQCPHPPDADGELNDPIADQLDRMEALLDENAERLNRLERLLLTIVGGGGAVSDDTRSEAVPPRATTATEILDAARGVRRRVTQRTLLAQLVERRLELTTRIRVQMLQLTDHVLGELRHRLGITDEPTVVPGAPVRVEGANHRGRN